MPYLTLVITNLAQQYRKVCHGSVVIRYFSPQSLVRFQASPCVICCRQSGSKTALSPSTLFSPLHYHSTNAPHSFIHLIPTLYNSSN